MKLSYDKLLCKKKHGKLHNPFSVWCHLEPVFEIGTFTIAKNIYGSRFQPVYHVYKLKFFAVKEFAMLL
jgi:hypothetical protein